MTSPATNGRPFSIRTLGEIEEGSHLGWIRGGILIGFVGYCLSFLSEFVGEVHIQAVLGEGVTALLLLSAYFLTTRGFVTHGAVLAVIAVWLELHITFFLDGSLGTSAVAVLPVLIAGTGILLGGRFALLMGASTAVSAPGVVFLGRLVRGDPQVFFAEDFKTTVTVGAVLMGMALIISMGLKTFSRTLEVARRNRKRFSDLVSGNPDGFIFLDHEGRIQEFNQAAEVLLGIPSSVARGRELSSLPLGEGTRVPTLSPLPDGAASGLEHTVLPMEERLVRPDGVEIWVEVLINPLHLDDGGEGRILVLRDVTERRTVEARAVQFGRIVEEARNEIYVFHRDTLEIFTANRGARENLGYSLEELRGMAMFQVQPTLTPEAGRLLARRLFEEGEEVVTLNTVHNRKDGSTYPLEVQFQRGLLEGTPSVLAFAMDISEREEAEENHRLLQAQLQHAQKMEAVGLLAGGVAHDFNNLLTVIGGCGEILLDIGSEEVKELTREILESQERGAALTQQLLAFARREIVAIEDLSLPAVIRGMEALIRRALSEQVVLALELEGEGRVKADKGQLEQIILNLVANARDAMPKGGTLAIRVQSSDSNGEPNVGGQFVSLSMIDTGEGMDPRIVDRVFEPFYTTKPRGKGTGLGLSTVHGIVSQNGGRIVVESQPGVGTTIRVIWPGSEPDPEDAALPSEGGVVPADRGTVLVAEDEEETRSVIQAVLEAEGYRMVGVEDGREALDLLEDETFHVDLLLTDIVMPGLGGMELADRARVVRPGIPVLFMSGYVDAHLKGPGERAEPFNLLAKPFRAQELRERVREMLPGFSSTRA